MFGNFTLTLLTVPLEVLASVVQGGGSTKTGGVPTLAKSLIHLESLGIPYICCEKSGHWMSLHLTPHTSLRLRCSIILPQE